jgi:transcriptional regulator
MPERRDFLIGLSAMLAMDEEASAADTIYIPERHAEKDRPFLIDFMEEFAFAMIITSKGGIRVTNVPTLFNRDANGWGSIWWHLAKSNPQNNSLDGTEEALVVFHGPHGYISPNWYTTKNAVPTWNFAVVHVKGTPTRIDDDKAFAGNLTRLVNKNEGQYGGGDTWDYSKLPESYLKGMRQGIVPYEMKIESVEAKFKLGHERTEKDREGVIAGLTANKGERTLLELTRDYYNRRKA